MIVTVRGTLTDATHGVANSVDVEYLVKGPIASFNNQSSAVTVLGQRVQVNRARTVFNNISGTHTGFNNFSSGGFSNLSGSRSAALPED